MLGSTFVGIDTNMRMSANDRSHRPGVINVRVGDQDVGDVTKLQPAGTEAQFEMFQTGCRPRVDQCHASRGTNHRSRLSLWYSKKLKIEKGHAGNQYGFFFQPSAPPPSTELVPSDFMTSFGFVVRSISKPNQLPIISSHVWSPQ